MNNYLNIKTKDLKIDLYLKLLDNFINFKINIIK